MFCQGKVPLKGNLAYEVCSICTITCQTVEKIAGLVVEKIDVLA